MFAARALKGGVTPADDLAEFARTFNMLRKGESGQKATASQQAAGTSAAARPSPTGQPPHDLSIRIWQLEQAGRQLVQTQMKGHPLRNLGV